MPQHIYYITHTHSHTRMARRKHALMDNMLPAMALRVIAAASACQTH